MARQSARGSECWEPLEQASDRERTPEIDDEDGHDDSGDDDIDDDHYYDYENEENLETFKEKNLLHKANHGGGSRGTKAQETIVPDHRHQNCFFWISIISFHNFRLISNCYNQHYVFIFSGQ